MPMAAEAEAHAGMGDVVSLVEKLQTGMEEEEARRMGERMMANKFDFNDFLKQIRFMSKLGGLTGLVKMMPGASSPACLQAAAAAAGLAQTHRPEASSCDEHTWQSVQACRLHCPSCCRASEAQQQLGALEGPSRALLARSEMQPKAVTAAQAWPSCRRSSCGGQRRG